MGGKTGEKRTGAELSATHYMAAPCSMGPGAAAVTEGSNHHQDHNYTSVSKGCGV